MAFSLPPLPYAETALEPHMSAETLSLHHGKHHKTYVETLNELVAGTPYEQMTLSNAPPARRPSKSYSTTPPRPGTTSSFSIRSVRMPRAGPARSWAR